MARLGSVLGAILAEVTRARLVSDRLSRELVDEYRSDPILASMSVPRVTIDQAELTLRFSVSDLTEGQPALPAEAGLGANLIRAIASSILPAMLAKRGVEEVERAAAVGHLVGPAEAPTVELPEAAVRAALGGDVASAANAVAKVALAKLRRLPRPTLEKLGDEAEFRRDFEARLAAEIPSSLSRASERDWVRAALASRVDIAVRTADLPTENEKIQELKLTLRGEDMSMILDMGREG